MNESSYSAVVFGATSAIATDILRSLVAEKPEPHLMLVGRNAARLEAVATDLRARGADCEVVVRDLLDPDTDWNALLGANPWELFLIAHGSLPDQPQTESDPHAAGRELAVNLISPIRIANACARLIERRGRGTLAIIGSVAGDRGRASNHLYGAAKSGLETFAEGLRHRLASRKHARVVFMKPGMTDTPMTDDIPKGPLFSSSETVGRLGWQAISRGKAVAYLPFWWRFVMLAIRLMPRSVFHRTRL